VIKTLDITWRLLLFPMRPAGLYRPRGCQKRRRGETRWFSPLL